MQRGQSKEDVPYKLQFRFNGSAFDIHEGNRNQCRCGRTLSSRTSWGKRESAAIDCL